MTTIYTHKGYDIQVKAVAKRIEIGYTINHPDFTGRRFSLVDDAIKAIDQM